MGNVDRAILCALALIAIQSAPPVVAQAISPYGQLQSPSSPPPPSAQTPERSLVLGPSITLPSGVAVGRTIGTFDVSSVGAAEYSISLWTPAAIAGLRPALSLNYVSTFANGLTGVGWSVGGLPSVTRCYKTVAQNGVAGAPDVAITDVFCLGGNVLRKFSGTYGADGAQYQTELADFSLIISHSTAGAGPAWFEVYAKNGLIYEYGNINAGQSTAHAALLAAGSSTVIRWAINKIRDRFGNHVDIDYTNDATNHVLRPLTITYAAPSSGTVTPQYQVAFGYESRSSPLSWYYAGTLSQEANRLNQISIQAWNGAAYSPARSYFLTYTPGTTGLDRISSISECSPTQCFPSTTVNYQEATSGWGGDTAVSGVPANSAGLGRLDLNGDGNDDLIYQNGGTYYYLLGQPSGTFQGPYSTGIVNPASGAIAIDYRAKHRADLAFKNASGNVRVCSFATAGSVFTCVDTSTPFVLGSLAADIDGDGYEDLVYISGNAVSYQRNLQGAGFGTATLLYRAVLGETLSYLMSTNNGPSSGRLRDFNGDGRDDLMFYVQYCGGLPADKCPPYPYTYYWTTLVSKADGTYVIGAQFPQSGVGGLWFPIFGDFNGDGCADVVMADGSSGHLDVSFGACDGTAFTAFSYTAATSFPTATYSSGNWAYGADVNGDRRDDLLLYNNSTGTWGYALSTGGNFGAWTPISPTLTKLSSVGDFNGDGMADIAGLTTAALNYRLHNGVAGDLANAITDGFGIGFSPSYAPISHTTTYTRGSGATYPEADYSGPTWVVTSYSASDGVGATYTVAETYNGARLNMAGRGFEGFLSKEAHDSARGLYVKDSYSLLFPLTGMLTERTLYQSDGTTKIVDVANTTPAPGYATLDNTSNNQRYFPYVGQSVVSTYEVSGALNGSLITQATTTIAYAGPNGFTYGNPSQIATTVVDKDSTPSPWYGDSYTDTRNITPLEVGAASLPTGWCIHLPSQVSETRTSQSGYPVTSLTHTTSFAVNGSSQCEMDGHTVEPSSSLDKVVTSYGYTDGCGNVNSVSVTGQTPAGTQMTARSTTFSYGSRCIAPETITNALGQAGTVGYRYDLGLPTSATDPNGLTTSWTYNDIGQKTLEQRPDGTQTSLSLTGCSSPPCWGDQNLRYYVQKNDKDSTSGHTTYWFTAQYYDQLGRLKYDEPLQSNGAQTTTYLSYDNQGRLVGRTNPFGNGFSSHTTNFAYDIVGRLVQQSRPISSTNSTLEYTNYSYQGRTETIQDPKGYTTTRKSDVLGELLRVIDPDGSSTTSYAYDPFGHQTSTTDPAGNVATRSYDTPLGYLLTTSADQDRGTWTYQYDSLGELWNVRDAKTSAPSWTQQLTYDALGRTLSRVESEGTTNWTWGTVAANHEIGRLTQLSATLSGISDAEAYTYDAFGRLATHRQTWNGSSYQIGYAYNSVGKLDTLTYPSTPLSGSPFQVKYGYANGYLSSLQNFTGGTAGTTFWQLTAGTANMDPWGHVVDETLGTTTAVRIQSAFDAVTSRIATREAGSGGSANNLQNLAYQWDVNGNLSQRQDLKQSLTEAFNYDNLNRISTSTLNGAQNLSVTIDGTGNITQRVEGGVTYPYTYDATHKHAVATVGTGGNQTSYTYDANGNMASRAGSTISWSSYNMPTTINAGAVSSSFWYGPDRQRKQQNASYTTDGDIGTEATVYVAGLLEVETTPAQTHYKHFVQVPGGTQVIYDLQSSSGTQITYITADHLGSGNLLLNGAGSTLVNESYSAYGYRRTSNWSGPLTPASADYSTIASTTRRGFTDGFHEMLDNVGLIHMNGRVYDPVIGRFLSPDRTGGSIGDSQKANPYSYVSNRPLSRTDPTGWDECASAGQCDPNNPGGGGGGGGGGGDNSGGGGNTSGGDTSGGNTGGSDTSGGNTGSNDNSGGDNSGTTGGPAAAPPGTCDGCEVNVQSTREPPASDQIPDLAGGDIVVVASRPPKKQCGNVTLGVGAVVQGPVVGGSTAGVSGGTAVGVSYGGSLLDTRVFIQVSANALAGAGEVMAVGLSSSASLEPVPIGVDTVDTLHTEVNAAEGVAFSASEDVHTDNGGLSSVGGYHESMRGGRLGFGEGGAVGSGPGTSTTIGFPSMRDVINALGFGPLLIGDAPGCK